MRPVNLFCIPFAGGSKYAYYPYVQAAPPQLVIHPVELPGRGERLHEPLCQGVEEAVESLFAAIAPKLGAPYAIYGHSMGALLGYYLTRKMQRESRPCPVHLFFSGCVGPACWPYGETFHQLPGKDLIARVQELGGGLGHALNDPEVAGFFEPILRADFRVIETLNYREQPPLNIPISLYMGREEEATPDQVQTWQQETIHPVTTRWLPGDHFFIFQNAYKLLKSIADNLNNYQHESTTVLP